MTHTTAAVSALPFASPAPRTDPGDPAGTGPAATGQNGSRVESDFAAQLEQARSPGQSLRAHGQRGGLPARRAGAAPAHGRPSRQRNSPSSPQSRPTLSGAVSPVGPEPATAGNGTADVFVGGAGRPAGKRTIHAPAGTPGRGTKSAVPDAPVALESPAPVLAVTSAGHSEAAPASTGSTGSGLLAEATGMPAARVPAPQDGPIAGATAGARTANAGPVSRAAPEADAGAAFASMGKASAGDPAAVGAGRRELPLVAAQPASRDAAGAVPSNGAVRADDPASSALSAMPASTDSLGQSLTQDPLGTASALLGVHDPQARPAGPRGARSGRPVATTAADATAPAASSKPAPPGDTLARGPIGPGEPSARSLRAPGPAALAAKPAPADGLTPVLAQATPRGARTAQARPLAAVSASESMRSELKAIVPGAAGLPGSPHAGAAAPAPTSSGPARLAATKGGTGTNAVTVDPVSTPVTAVAVRRAGVPAEPADDPAAAPRTQARAAGQLMPDPSAHALPGARSTPADPDGTSGTRSLGEASPSSSAGVDPAAANGMQHGFPATGAVLPQHAAAPAQLARVEVPTPVFAPEFPQALASQVAMNLRDGDSRVELTLTPADLGPVRIEMSLDGSLASIAFAADSADARTAIEQSLPVLREMLARDGLSLGQTDIGGGHGGRQARPDHTGNPSAETGGGRGQDPGPRRGSDAPADNSAQPAARHARSHRGSIDLFA